MPSSPASVGLAGAHSLTKTQAMEPSRQTWSSYGPPYPLGRWSFKVFFFCDRYERHSCFLCVCVCMRVCGRTILNTTSRTIPTHTSSEFQEHPPRSTAAVQPRYSSSNSGTTLTPRGLMHHTSIGTPVFPLYNLRQPRDFKSSTSEGEPFYCIILLQ